MVTVNWRKNGRGRSSSSFNIVVHYIVRYASKVLIPNLAIVMVHMYVIRQNQ